MKTIKLNFCDWWPGFNPIDNYFYNLLKEEFNVEISNDPDYLFFSVFGNLHRNYKCKKIFYTGENVTPPLGYCDYSFSFDCLDDVRNYRLPHYLLYPGYYELVSEKKIEDWMINRKFCNFVASNPNCHERNQFVEKLSRYKKVDSGGRWMNNIGFAVENKREFQSNYKFSIAFENSAYRPGYEWYITEKIMEPMTVNSIPIYYGGSKVKEDFNSKSFINCHDFMSLDDAIEYIIEMDKDDNKYMEALKQSWFNNNKIPDNNKEENIKYFLYEIFR